MESLSLIAGGLAARRLSDEAVATRAVGGDAGAFGELFRRYRRRISAFCASRLGDDGRGEDAAQETFVRVLRATPQPIQNAQAWLFTIAANVCTDTQRGASNSELPTDDAGLGDDLPTPDSATEVMRRETARVVFLALRRLPARSRTALMLREFHGMSSAEIAESMGISTKAVDPLVSRARDAFGVAYAEVGHFPERCRENVERIYRDLGTGLEPAEQAELKAHLEVCPRCKAEHRRAHSPRYQHALLPFLVPGVAKLGILGRALRTAASSPGVLHGVPFAGAATAAVLSLALLAPTAVDYQLAHKIDGLRASMVPLASASAVTFSTQRRLAKMPVWPLRTQADSGRARAHDTSSRDLCTPSYRICDSGASVGAHHASSEHTTSGIGAHNSTMTGATHDAGTTHDGDGSTSGHMTH